jgi:phosphoribosyl-AMP cyclohydrolase
LFLRLTNWGEKMDLDFAKDNGLIPAIIQDSATRDVLMLGFMNREALDKTSQSGFVTFYSRSRKKLWTKGESSGQRLLLREMRVDCDLDAILVLVQLAGEAVCHEGYRSCFFRSLTAEGESAVIAERLLSPEQLYRKEEK